MSGRAPVLFVAAVLVGADGAGANGSALWDRGASARAAATVASPFREAGPGGACELARADRATTPSVRCLACHNGSSGPGIGASHPLDVDYASVALRDADRYVAPALLPREVPLVNGKIACTSCHDGGSPNPKHVAITGQLCESCHRL